jgi:hypothetical protein
VIHDRLADAADVLDLRALADPDPVVDDAAQVLDEVAVDLGRDAGDGLPGEHLDPRVRGRAGARGQEGGRARGQARAQELTTIGRIHGAEPYPGGPRASSPAAV